MAVDRNEKKIQKKNGVYRNEYKGKSTQLELEKTKGDALETTQQFKEKHAAFLKEYDGVMKGRLLLYQYKSTCFTSTKVLALPAQRYLLTSTKVKILRPEELRAADVC